MGTRGRCPTPFGLTINRGMCGSVSFIAFLDRERPNFMRRPRFAEKSNFSSFSQAYFACIMVRVALSVAVSSV